MKRFAFTAVCAVVALCGCMKDIEVSPSVETHYITFKADASATKTSMVYDDEKGAYTMIWEEGDQIAIFEYAEGFYFPVKYLSEPLEAGDISNEGQTADFRVSVTDAAGSDFSYVAVYPAVSSGGYEPSCEYLDLDKGDDYWRNEWEYEGPAAGSHLLLRVVLPYEQSPSSDCFDPSSNTMVSKVIESDGQIEEVADLQFARIGSILKISLTGLTDYVGQQISSARFLFGESFGGNLNCDYDTFLERYRFYKGFNEINLTPQSVTIDENGCADLWIRCYAGEITDWFSLYITIGDAIKGNGEAVTLARYVDLASLSRTIVIPEGKMARFSVGSWGVADVDGVNNISYKVNPAKNGFTATWNDVTNAAGYDFWYWSNTDPENKIKVNTITDNGDGTHSVTVAGLSPDTYNLKISPVPAAGHAMIDPNYYYPVSVPVGVEVTKDVYNSYFTESLSDLVASYDYEGLELSYRNIRQSSWGATLVTSKSDWSIWNTAEFCNEICSMTFVADASTATEYQPYTDRNQVDHMIRPMDYVKVLASSGNGIWEQVEPQFNDPDIQNNKYPVTYTFPSGTKYFSVSSDTEKLNDVAPPLQPEYPASLMCTFYSIQMQIYE